MKKIVGDAKLEIIVGDITKQSTEAIVNAANNRLIPGGGVDGAIHKAAGPLLYNECKKLGGCNTGEAKLTGGYNLPSKFVIQTVGPRYSGSNKDKEQLGPLTIGLALTKVIKNSSETAKPRQQRIVVIGDGDFLSNAYLGNQGNRDLGYNILNWLSHDDNFIAIPVAVTPDKELTMSKTMGVIIALVFLIILPLLLLASGTYIWLKRRKQ